MIHHQKQVSSGSSATPVTSPTTMMSSSNSSSSASTLDSNPPVAVATSSSDEKKHNNTPSPLDETQVQVVPGVPRQSSTADDGKSFQQAYNHSHYSQVIRHGIDSRVAPFAGVVAPDVVGTEEDDEPEDLHPPQEDHVFGIVPASLIQMPLMDQVKRIPFFFLVCITIQCFILNFTTIRYPDPKTQNQLPDLLFDLLPRHRALEEVTAKLLLTMNISCFTVLFFAWRIATKRMEPRQLPAVRGLTPRRYLHIMIWLRWWCTFAIASLLRALTVIMTTLPSTNNQCKERPTIDNIWLNTLKGIYSLGAKNIHCGDLLFSGHTVAIMNAFWACWTYGPLVHPVIRPFVTLVSGAAFCTMLSSRSHYTDDIIVAVIVVTSVYWLIGHCPAQGVPLWVQAFLRPIHTLNCIIRGRKSILPEQSTSPLVTPREGKLEQGNNNNSGNGLKAISSSTGASFPPVIVTDKMEKQNKYSSDSDSDEHHLRSHRISPATSTVSKEMKTVHFPSNVVASSDDEHTDAKKLEQEDRTASHHNLLFATTNSSHHASGIFSSNSLGNSSHNVSTTLQRDNSHTNSF